MYLQKKNIFIPINIIYIVFQENTTVSLMAILRRRNQRERDYKTEGKQIQEHFMFILRSLCRCVVLSFVYSPLRNLDGLLEWLPRGRGQRVGCLPNFSPAFQQTKSALFFIAKSSPINSLTSPEEGVPGWISKHWCP